ncbi:MAG: ABC transporter permease [Dehalococcoidia bacterium]|nr:ABC transporter permease [Dehalococcoidia bacterium]
MSVIALRRRAINRPDVSLRALRVWQRHRDVYLQLWKSELIWPLVEPLITLFALGVGLGGLVELESGQSYIEFIAPGLLAVWPMWSASAECGWGSFFRMENQRTFDAIVATPVSIEDVITGEILWGATRALISTAYILVVISAWGLVDSPLALLVLPAAVIPGIMFASISLSYTSVAWSISSLNYFFAVFITPMFWLAGVFFPVERLPEWAQTVAWWLPATHAVKVYRALTSGDLGWSHLGDVVWMVVVAAAFYVIALYSMRRRLVK